MLCSVFVRRLRRGGSYEAFRAAWQPDRGFGVPVRVVNARSLEDPSEILSVGFVDLPASELERFLAKVAQSEARRHERIAQVVETTLHKGIYEILDDDDLS